MSNNQFGRFPISRHQCQQQKPMTLPEMVEKLRREASTMSPQELEQLVANIDAAARAQISLAVQNNNYGQPMK